MYQRDACLWPRPAATIAAPFGHFPNLAQRRCLVSVGQTSLSHNSAKAAAHSICLTSMQYGRVVWECECTSVWVCLSVPVSVYGCVWVPSSCLLFGHFVAILFYIYLALLLPFCCALCDISTRCECCCCLGPPNPLLRVYLYAKYVNLRSTTWMKK